MVRSGASRTAMERAHGVCVFSRQPPIYRTQIAFVNIAVDTYSGGGLFESGATWTYQRSVEVIREDGTWKINTMEYFY